MALNEILQALARKPDLNSSFRVEKYRPNTLDDVAGHQDILATINKFVELNVCWRRL